VDNAPRCAVLIIELLHVAWLSFPDEENEHMNATSPRRAPARNVRRRRAALALEAMEGRLAPSLALVVTPPQVAGVVLDFPHHPAIPTNPCTSGIARIPFPHNPDFPTGPCAGGGMVSQFPHNPG
jgi:hypothetical protein